MTTTTTLSELTGDYVLDPAGTRIGFAVRQAILTTVRGQFGEFDGTAHLDGDDPSESRARITIQAASIQTPSQRRDDHLRRAFLDVSNHPAITFAATGVAQLSETTFNVTGDLTIRGATRPVTVAFELTGAGYDPQGTFRAGFRGTVTIDRRDWGVSWNAVLEGGGVLVSQKVTLELTAAAVRRS
ncbi:MAG TPA: YceI family protein [Streptosporangiaceae bacterium]|nr:YceI family protein [Streptosporangiaceae bacterium]